MTEAAARRRRPAPPRFLNLLLGLLAVLLPALIAGSHLDAPLTPAETARIDEALAVQANPAAAAPLAARLLYGATLPDEPRAAFATAPAATAARARLAAVLFVLLSAAAFYLLVSLARGGSVALLACLALAGLPPIADDGATLQPEPVAALFALVATLVLCSYALAVSRRHSVAGVRPLMLLGMGLLAGAAFALAALAASGGAVLLLVPGGVLTLACAVQTTQWWRLWRRKRLTPFALRAMTGRAWPWLLLTLGVTLAGALVLLSAQARSTIPPPSATAAGLLPNSPVVAVLFVALAALGGLRLLFEGGVRLSQRRRIDSTVVVLLFVAVLLMHHAFRGAGTAAQPASFALALLVGEGMFTAILLFVGWLLVRGRRTA